MGNPILKTEKLTKRFPGMIANDSISLELYEGEITAIIGENGAGKSTFCKMLTGIYQPDEGKIYINGQEVHFHDASESMKNNIGMVYQERNLVPMLTGAQNICLGSNAVKGVFLKEKEIEKNAYAIRDMLKLNVPLDVPIETLGAGEQQLIEIMRALYVKPKILILDEPTASLGVSEVEPFLDFVRNMTKQMNIAAIFISHKIEEVFEVADKIAVFTDGKNVLTDSASNMTQEQCIRAMLRNNSIKDIAKHPHPDRGQEVIRLESGIYDKKEHTLNFVARTGEVVGCYGLVGSGRTEMAEAMFGLRKAELKGYTFNGQPIQNPKPMDSINRGIVLTPERRINGMFTTQSLVDNICNMFIGKRLSNRSGFINFKKCASFTDEVLNRNKVKYTTTNQSITELSGGNIQKIIIGRAVAVENCRFIMVDEPTAGMDIGAKYEVYARLRALADEDNKSIMFISSELDELLGVCDRIYIFADGNIVDEFQLEEFNKQDILSTAVRGHSIR